MATATKLVQVPHREAEPRMYERHYSPAELGELWNLSADTVRRMFEQEPGRVGLRESSAVVIAPFSHAAHSRIGRRACVLTFQQRRPEVRE